MYFIYQIQSSSRLYDTDQRWFALNTVTNNCLFSGRVGDHWEAWEGVGIKNRHDQYISMRMVNNRIGRVSHSAERIWHA
jgi:hypothetical protein